MKSNLVVYLNFSEMTLDVLQAMVRYRSVEWNAGCVQLLQKRQTIPNWDC